MAMALHNKATTSLQTPCTEAMAGLLMVYHLSYVYQTDSVALQVTI